MVRRTEWSAGVPAPVLFSEEALYGKVGRPGDVGATMGQNSRLQVPAAIGPVRNPRYRKSSGEPVASLYAIMVPGSRLRMSTPEIVGELIERDAALASAALKTIGNLEGVNARKLLPRAALNFLGPYSAALYFMERVIQSPTFNPDFVQALHSRLRPFERMADQMLMVARERGYFDDPEAGEPLRWLETCHEQVKDCMVALESMLDPQLDDLMAAALEEHRRDETVSLDSIP